MSIIKVFNFFKITLLVRYLFRQNLLLILIILGIGTGVYLLTDLFDRLDNFLEVKNIAASIIVKYFIFKIPMIFAQILPAAFLIGTIIQLCFMAKNREIIALQTGGVSFWHLVTFVLMIGIFWGFVQFFLSQSLGVKGDQNSNKIWQEKVTGNYIFNDLLTNVWFIDGNYMVYCGAVSLKYKSGVNILVYEIIKDTIKVQRIIKANICTMDNDFWVLHGANVYTPSGFTQEINVQVVLPIKQNLKHFATAADVSRNPSRLPVWQLNNAIKKLESSGSNVESLRTAWHLKISYAASLLVMGIMAIALITWRESFYINVSLGLLITFVFYALFTVSGTLGEKGILSPMLAAWGPLLGAGVLALLRIIYYLQPRFLRELFGK